MTRCSLTKQEIGPIQCGHVTDSTSRQIVLGWDLARGLPTIATEGPLKQVSRMRPLLHRTRSADPCHRSETPDHAAPESSSNRRPRQSSIGNGDVEACAETRERPPNPEPRPRSSAPRLAVARSRQTAVSRTVDPSVPSRDPAIVGPTPSGMTDT